MVYSFRGVSQSQIESHWLYEGSMRVNQAFSRLYTTPFSSNNYTAKNLTVHYAALGILVRTQKVDDSDELWKQIKQQVTDITSGEGNMMDTNGAAILPDIVPGKLQAWSSNMDKKPVFDMREPSEQRIDPDLLDEEWNEDIS